MNHISSPEGPYGNKNFRTRKGKIKIYEGNKILEIINNKKINVCNVHFQGSAKKNLNRFTKYKLNY